MRRVCFGCVVRGASGVGFTCDVKFSSGSSVLLILRAFDSVRLGCLSPRDPGIVHLPVDAFFSLFHEPCAQERNRSFTSTYSALSELEFTATTVIRGSLISRHPQAQRQ